MSTVSLHAGAVTIRIFGIRTGRQVFAGRFTYPAITVLGTITVCILLTPRDTGMKQTIMLRRTVRRRITLANLQDTLIVLAILKRLTSLTRVQITLCPIPVRGRRFTLTPPASIRILARRTPANLCVRTVHARPQRTLLSRRTTHPRTRITRLAAPRTVRYLPIIRTPAILTQ